MKINIKNRIKSICATLFISLFLSCNNGVIEELEKRNTFLSSLANLGNDFLNIFTSFGDSLGGVLGFKVGAKKSDIADYFKKVKETVEGVKSKLKTIVENMKSQENSNATAVENAVKTFIDNTLDKIIEGARTVSDAIGDSNDPIGNADTVGGSAKGAPGETENLIKGIKSIVDIVLKNDEGNAEAGDNNKSDDGTIGSSRGANAGEAGKLFGNTLNSGAISDTNAKKAVTDAAKNLFQQ
ncbi:Variable outer membrane protein (plasmid) [Borrelia coriaceae ATCC 43381]|uniref:Variable large protein n=1 Tax=Borrelia coriaceae ATCC 43381 TaxID=1408429 RepID=W5SWT1_9SPIR|nr:Variable outer membrane protein [Borrelia coriaceae ATCC 43381]